jgi:hypothetical protein
MTAAITVSARRGGSSPPSDAADTGARASAISGRGRLEILLDPDDVVTRHRNAFGEALPARSAEEARQAAS